MNNTGLCSMIPSLLHIGSMSSSKRIDEGTLRTRLPRAHKKAFKWVSLVWRNSPADKLSIGSSTWMRESQGKAAARHERACRTWRKSVGGHNTRISTLSDFSWCAQSVASTWKMKLQLRRPAQKRLSLGSCAGPQIFAKNQSSYIVDLRKTKYFL